MRPRSPWNRGPVEVPLRPCGSVRMALRCIFRDPRPWTWGSVEIRGLGSLRFDVDREGFVWLLAEGQWQTIDRLIVEDSPRFGWVHSGSHCFVRTPTR